MSRTRGSSPGGQSSVGDAFLREVAQAPAVRPFIGTLLNRTYEVRRVIGTGGMGAVYEAVNVRLAKRVAVKVLLNVAARDAELLTRFRREAKIAAELAHPHIIDVLDFNEAEDGTPYMVMEFLQGEDLDAALRRPGGVSLGRMVSIVRQVCSALQAAHASNVVHRDLKPANIFLCTNKAFEDFVVVLDFGISKILGSASVHTQTAAVIGTPLYMAPEMAEGCHAAVGPAADIFGLGSIMYQMLAGKPPFAADSMPALLYKIVHEEVAPLRELRPELPEAVAAVVSRAMMKAPSDRHASAAALSAALQEALAGPALLAGHQGESGPDPRDDGRSLARAATQLAATATEAPVAALSPMPLAATVTEPAAMPNEPAATVNEPAATPNEPVAGRRWVLPSVGAAVVLIAAVLAVRAWSSADLPEPGERLPRPSGPLAAVVPSTQRPDARPDAKRATAQRPDASPRRRLTPRKPSDRRTTKATKATKKSERPAPPLPVGGRIPEGLERTRIRNHAATFST